MALAGARARAGGQQAGFPSSQPLQKRPAASNLSDFFYLLMYGFSFFPFFLIDQIVKIQKEISQ